MNVGMLDAISLLLTLIGIVVLLRGWERALSRDARLFVLAVLLLGCIHATSNFLEWSMPLLHQWAEMIDRIGDFANILTPVCFFFFLYVILQDEARSVLQQREDELRESQQQLSEAHEELRHYSDGLEEVVQQRTAELQAKHESLEQAFEHQKAMQSQLIESEQLAVLGRLAASVTHEVNNPLGAISAAGRTVSNSVTALSENATNLERLVDDGRFADVLKLLKFAARHASRLSTREQRQARETLIERLTEADIDETREKATLLLKLGIDADADITALSALLGRPDAVSILQWATQLANIRGATEIIEAATSQASKVIFAWRSYLHQAPDRGMSLTDIAQNIDNVLTLYRGQLRRNDVDVERRFETAPPVHCHADEIAQVWTNLIHNAIQAMNGPGKLTVSVHREEEDTVVVSVADTGPGIPENIRDRIFEPFFTSKAASEGTGLGLDIVRNIIHRHHGDIRFETEEGQGATFFVRLPVEQPGASEEGVQPEAESLAGVTPHH